MKKLKLKNFLNFPGLRLGRHDLHEVSGDEIIVRPLTKTYFEKMAGCLKTGGRLSKRLLEERLADKAREDLP